MFGLRPRGTVIAEGLKIMGSVTAEGLVEVNGQIEGELHCTSLIMSRKAHIAGAITAERVVVDGRIEGPIQAVDVILKSQAHVVGDIQFSIDRPPVAFSKKVIVAQSQNQCNDGSFGKATYELCSSAAECCSKSCVEFVEGDNGMAQPPQRRGCVYRKPKPGRNGDAVRQGSRVN
jgi:cytoskeletal protein CcmA (bactofilin family)